jgi:cysteine desulfurase/selenocysteine lyase
MKPREKRRDPIAYSALRCVSLTRSVDSQVARFIGAASPTEVVFTRGATEAINLVANTWGSATLRAGDEIALSVLEHHSNLVPWQLLAARSGCVLRFASLGAGGAPPGLVEWRAAITPRTRLVATAAVSNVLGSAAPVAQLAEMCRSVGAKLLLDACQSVPHVPTDVSSLGADFLVASGHKMCGPTGIGFLWARPEILAAMPPWQGGGEMIATVGLESSSFAEPPARFEAGTPAIAEAIGLGAACDYLSALGMRNVAAWEAEMGGYLYDTLRSRVPGISIYGPVPAGLKGGHGVRSALAAFNVKGLHATDVSTLLDASGVAVRSGHHCCQPLHAALGVGASARASLYVYNTKAEVDAAADALAEVCTFLRDAGAATEPL